MTKKEVFQEIEFLQRGFMYSDLSLTEKLLIYENIKTLISLDTVRDILIRIDLLKICASELPITENGRMLGILDTIQKTLIPKTITDVDKSLNW